ncbi:MAG TPA: CapA family protein [Tissierellales bacterium]|nr:CapA family protein [Tissierellales bacterium]
MGRKKAGKRSNLLIILVSLVILFFAAQNISSFDKIQKNLDEKSEATETTPKEDEENRDEVDKVIDKKTTATILATGDIMFHSPQIKAGYNPAMDSYDFNGPFKHVKKYIESADLSLGNFETVTAGPEVGFVGYPNFNSPVETLDAIKNAGYDILTTANNHCLDQRKEGLISTIKAIEDRGMKNIGTYKEPNSSLLIENINDISMAILSYTYGCNGMEHTLDPKELNYMINLIDEEKIKEDIEKAKDEDVDLIIVFIHWGNEYQQEPSQEQIDLGNKLADWGVDIILGSHPHVVQSSDIITKNGSETFVIYSMGNFLSNQRRENVNNKYTEDGVIVKLQVEKNFKDEETKIKEIQYIPTWVNKYTANGKFQYEIIPTGEVLKGQENYDTITKEAFLKIEDSFNNTMKKLEN